MRVTIVKSRLRAARKSWAKNEISADVAARGNFISGVLQGLGEAMRIITQAQKEEIEKTKKERHALSRWTGLSLYKACESAYGRLKEGDRPTALRILRQALDRVTPHL